MDFRWVYFRWFILAYFNCTLVNHFWTFRSICQRGSFEKHGLQTGLLSDRHIFRVVNHLQIQKKSPLDQKKMETDVIVLNLVQVI